MIHLFGPSEKHVESDIYSEVHISLKWVPIPVYKILTYKFILLEQGICTSIWKCGHDLYPLRKSYSIRMKISQNPTTVAAAATAGMSIVLVGTVEREAQCKGVDKWTCSCASKLVLVVYRVIRQLEERSYYITHRI